MPVDRPSHAADLHRYSSPTMARCSAAKATGNPETNFMVCACPSDFPQNDTRPRVGGLFSTPGFVFRISPEEAMLTTKKAPGEPNSQVAYGTPQVAHTASM